MAKGIRNQTRPFAPEVPRAHSSYTMLDRPKRTFEEFKRDLINYKLKKELGLV